MESSVCSDENALAKMKQAHAGRAKPNQVHFKQRLIEEETAEESEGNNEDLQMVNGSRHQNQSHKFIQ